MRFVYLVVCLPVSMCAEGDGDGKGNGDKSDKDDKPGSYKMLDLAMIFHKVDSGCF